MTSISIFAFKEDFMETTKLCAWDEETASIVLISITATKLQKIINGANTCQDKLRAILNYKYPQDKTGFFNNELVRTKQKDFLTLKAYHKQITHIVDRLAVCQSLNDVEKQRKIEETFRGGLTTNTALEIIKYQGHQFEELLQLHLDQEESLIQIILEKDNYQPARSSNPHKQQPQRPRRTKEMWCDYHECSTHDSTQSRARHQQRPHYNHSRNHQYDNKHGNYPTRQAFTKNNYTQMNNNKQGAYGDRQQNNNKKNNTKTWALRETTAPSQALQIRGTAAKKELNMIVDTGSALNYCSKTLAKDIGADIKKGTAITAELADGSKVTTTDTADITFYIQDEKEISYMDTFRILEGPTAELLLGMQFLENNNSSLDLGAKTLTLDGRCYQLPAAKQNRLLNKAEETLMEKTKIWNTRTETEEESGAWNTLIAQTKITNPILGKIDGAYHHIKLTKEAPIKLKPYPIPHSKYEQTREEMKRLLELDVIQPSTSCYSFPAFPIYKKNNKIRLVIDYRRLNAITHKEPCSLENTFFSIQRTTGAKWYTALDLNMGYYQIEVEPSDRHKTAFQIAGSQYEFKRMPFGLSNAPATFQKAISTLMSDLKYVLVYLDDILIFSEDEKTHFEHVETVLSILRAHNISINFEKSKFKKEKIEYLGFILDGNGLKPITNNVEEISLIKPTKKKDIQRIMGHLNWFKPFVQRFSNRTSFLTDPLKDNVKITWDDSQAKKLQQLIKDIKESEGLSKPDDTKEFVIETDANLTGIAAVLKQGDNIVSIFGAKLKESELNYFITKKGTFATIRALEYFKPLIFDRQITLRTDSLNSLGGSNLSRRQQRWKLLLSEYNIEIKHIKGKDNVYADALSRLARIHGTKPCSMEDFKKIIVRDFTVYTLPPKGGAGDLKIITIEDRDVVHRNNRILINPNQNKELIQLAHEYLIHPGTRAMYNLFRKYFEVKDLKKICHDVASTCKECQTTKPNKPKAGKITGHLSQKEESNTIGIDVLGPLNTCHFNFQKIKKPNFYILLSTDMDTRFSKVTITEKTTAKEVIKHLETVRKHDFPNTSFILSDNGKQFNCNELEDYCAERGIIEKKTSFYNPTANSVVERRNQEILVVLRNSKNIDEKELKERIERRLNHLPDSRTGLSPAELKTRVGSIDLLSRDLQRQVDEALLKREQNAEERNKKSNKNRIPYKYTEGEEVLIKKMIREDKLDVLFEGPFTIHKLDRNSNQITVKNRKQRN